MKKIQRVLPVAMTILIIALPVFLMAQTGTEPPPDPDAAKGIDFSQGGRVLDDWFMQGFLHDFDALLRGEYSIFIGMAKAIGGMCTLLFFAGRAYEMMLTGRWETLPLLRPFALYMVIAYWGTFISLISAPTKAMDDIMYQKQDAQYQKIDAKRLIRHEYQRALVETIFEEQAAAKVADEDSKSLLEKGADLVTGGLKEQWNELRRTVVQGYLKMQLQFQLWVTQLLDFLGLIILRLSVYVILTMKIIYMAILAMMGPIAVGFSILPAFRDSFNSWMARFISVSFYFTIAMIILFIGGIFQEFAYDAEIERYKELIDRMGNTNADSMEKAVQLSLTNGVLSFGIVLLSFLLTACCMFTVPSISTWIVSTSGINSAMGGSGRAASTILRRIARV